MRKPYGIDLTDKPTITQAYQSYDILTRTDVLAILSKIITNEEKTVDKLKAIELFYKIRRDEDEPIEDKDVTVNVVYK